MPTATLQKPAVYSAHPEPSVSHPHPMLIFAGRSSADLAAKIAKEIDVQLGSADTTPHPNGECMVKIGNNVRARDVFVIQSVCPSMNRTTQHSCTGINDNLMELLVWGNALSLASAHRITAVIPYFGYARQDRKAQSRTPITAKLVCDLLQAAGFDRVLTMDLHCDQIQGFFNSKVCQLDHLSAGKIFSHYFSEKEELENAVILCPDLGNIKKADKYRRGMPSSVGMAVIDKRRDPQTGDITVNRITGDCIKGKDVILFDDIISTAGTMMGAIKIGKQNGATGFYIAATHGEFISPAADRLSDPMIKEICVTDTIPLLPDIADRLPITVLSVAELFGQSIRHVHHGHSISALL